MLIFFYEPLPPLALSPSTPSRAPHHPPHRRHEYPCWGPANVAHCPKIVSLSNYLSSREATCLPDRPTRSAPIFWYPLNIWRQKITIYVKFCTSYFLPFMNPDSNLSPCNRIWGWDVCIALILVGRGGWNSTR